MLNLKAIKELFLNSLDVFISNKKLILLSVFVDAVFLLSLFYMNFQLFMQTQSDILELASIIQDKAKDLPEGDIGNLDAFLLADDRFTTYYNRLLYLIGLFLGLVFLLCAVLNSFAWFAAKRMTEHVSLKSYFPRFFGLSIIWFLCFLSAIYFRIKLLDYTVYHPFPLIGKSFADVLFIAFLFLIYYASSVSFAAIPSKPFLSLFLSNLKKKSCIFSFFASVLLLIILILNVYWGFSYHYALGIALTIILFLPGLGFSRLLFVNAIKTVL